MGGCCCGGCRTPPSDPREGAGALQNVIEVQQYCCRCIPKQVCISITEGSTTSHVLVAKGCGSAAYEGDPIQYRALVTIGGDEVFINFRLKVIDEQCYIGWDIPDLDLSDQTLIDHTIPADEELCNYGMMSKQCAEFGGEWTVEDPALTISISDTPTLDLKDLVECAGCSCICKCLCISIYSRNATTGVFTLVGSNDVVCATLSRSTVEGCGNSEFYDTPWIAAWTSNDWTIRLGDQYDRQISEYELIAGSESVSGTCTVRDAVWIGDRNEHSITGESIQVVYEWDIEHRTAKSVKWLGRSYDENSVIRFDAWNWVSSQWELVTSVDGRPDSTTINRAMFSNLDADYTGTGVDEGKVKIRLTVHYGDALHTDMIRLVTSECCAFTLTPPESITLESTPAIIPLTGANACPSPNPSWVMTATDDTEWYVSASCSWCGGTCGTSATACCPRPIGNLLFAEVTLGCPTCAPATIVVPLSSDGSGAIWDGEVTVCGQTLSLSFSCEGTAWHISAVISGGCNWSGDASSVDCETFTVSFSGTLTGGLGCCGPTGDPNATPSIGITVIE